MVNDDAKNFLGINNSYTLGARLLFVAAQRSHVNVFGLVEATLGISYMGTPPNETQLTSIGLGGGMGVEYFFWELPNLGLTAELRVGVSIQQAESMSAMIAGFAPSPLIGIHYYF